jgi:hypothetical protein
VIGDPSLPQAPSWGGGGFTVQEHGSLALAGVVVAGALAVETGGSLALNEVTFGANGCVTVEGTGQLIAPTTPPECAASCGTIEHCATIRCTGGAVAVCDACEDGYYSFRHDEEQGRCLENSVTLAQAGFTDEAQGLFSFTFAGSVPSDLVGGEMTVPQTASLSLAGTGAETIGASFSVTGGSLSVAGMAMSQASLGSAQGGAGAGSTLRLAAVTVPEAPGAGELTGTMTVGADGSTTSEPADMLEEVLAAWPHFTVISGPCAVSEGGRCVGRPGGYLPSEVCEIAVGGGGGVLGPCGVFDTENSDYDYVTLPDGSRHGGSDCPAGAVLAAGGSVGWASDRSYQGHGGNGLPVSEDGLGGGWQICFAA